MPELKNEIDSLNELRKGEEVFLKFPVNTSWTATTGFSSIYMMGSDVEKGKNTKYP